MSGGKNLRGEVEEKPLSKNATKIKRKAISKKTMSEKNCLRKSV